MEFFSDIYKKVKPTPRGALLFILTAVVLGGLFVFWLRFVLVDQKTTHYHANFSVYVNGVREKFDSPTFYEEVASCSSSFANPKALVHMHDNVSHVVHVHHHSATWGLFFENISYSVSRKALLTDDGLFVDGQGGNLTYILNGQIVPTIANRVIKSEDVLLIDFGTSSQAEIQQRYDEIIRDAGEYNRRDDPSACTGSKTEPFKDRFMRTLGIDGETR